MTKQVIGLDMDGVILDNTKNKLKFAKELGFELKPAESHSDIIEKVLPQRVLAELRHHLYSNPDTALEVELMEGAKQGLTRIKKSGNPYFLISRRKNPEIAKEILRKTGLWPKYFRNENTFFVVEPEDKDRKAIELGINIYLDDQPSVLGKLASVSQRFLFDRFKNFGDLPFEHEKVSSWKEFLSKAL